MSYQETVDFLFSSLPMYQRTGGAAYKANLDNTWKLDDFLGHPHKKYKSIHIAGTNGKGSVSHMLASVFHEAGFTTGLYTSPHLLDFRERIRVNGKMISEKQVVDFVSKIKSEIFDLVPSFFEMTVAMAFDHFANEKVDIAIIETGMGGRLDSTNIIEPEASIITNISMDHTAFLGNTKELIAKEKAGIIKPNTPLISTYGSPEVVRVLEEMSEQKKAPLVWANKIREFKYQTYTREQQSLFHFFNNNKQHNEIIECDLGGAYQSENIALVLAALDVIYKNAAWKISRENISKGLANVKQNTSIRGRWEVLGTNPRIICDTAHNEAGVETVMKQLVQIPCANLHIIWGMVGDKDIESIIRYLPASATYYLTQASIPRAMPVEKLAHAFQSAGITGNTYQTVKEAYKSALHMAEPDDALYIGGSTFVVADLLHYLND